MKLPTEVLEIATKEGYNVGVKTDAEILLDADFFRTLGRGLGWQEKGYPDKYEGHWKAQWSYEHHRLIDWIDDGKSVEDYFKELLLTK